MLLGTYLVFPPASVLGMTAFTQAFLRHAGDRDRCGRASGRAGLVGTGVAAGLAWHQFDDAIGDRGGAVSLLLITALIVAIFVRLGTGNAPDHQTLTPDVFKLPR